MSRKQIKSFFVVATALSAIVALSSCSTDMASRRYASENPQFGGPPGDHGPGGPQQGGPGFHGPQGPPQQQGPGPGFHGGPQGPGHGFAPVHVNQPIIFHNGGGGPGGPGFHGGPQGPGGGQRLWQQHQGWQHWNHPGYVPPVYDFDWNHVVSMTCTAEDAYGQQYPITEDGFNGPQWQAQQSNIEDDALDACYNQSSDNSSCFLAGCSPTYPVGYNPVP